MNRRAKSNTSLHQSFIKVGDVLLTGVDKKI